MILSAYLYFSAAIAHCKNAIWARFKFGKDFEEDADRDDKDVAIEASFLVEEVLVVRDDDNIE